MVEGARLESVYTGKGYRGFESLTLRWKAYFTSPQLIKKALKRNVDGLFAFFSIFLFYASLPNFTCAILCANRVASTQINEVRTKLNTKHLELTCYAK